MKYKCQSLKAWLVRKCTIFEEFRKLFVCIWTSFNIWKDILSQVEWFAEVCIHLLILLGACISVLFLKLFHQNWQYVNLSSHDNPISVFLILTCIGLVILYERNDITNAISKMIWTSRMAFTWTYQHISLMSFSNLLRERHYDIIQHIPNFV